MKKIFILSIILLWLIGCTKDDIMFFEGKDAMSIYIGQYEADSTVYSFAYSLPDVTKDTVFVKIRVQGAASAVDRTVEMTVADGTTAVVGQDYILPEFTLPAGSVEALYPVVLLRHTSQKGETKTLLVAIKSNADFEVGALGQEIGNSYSIAYYKIRFNDFLSMPAYWSAIQSYVGAFSVVKLQFMFSVYGSDKDFGSLTTGERLNMRLRLRTALAEYEAVNGPLMDENDQRVTF